MSKANEETNPSEQSERVERLVRWIPYIEEMGDMGALYYRPLRTTGRWKIKTGPYYCQHLFIEHKGLIFKKWVSESIIYFKHEETETIFSCT